jgi:hypothetical protein
MHSCDLLVVLATRIPFHIIGNRCCVFFLVWRHNSLLMAELFSSIFSLSFHRKSSWLFKIRVILLVINISILARNVLILNFCSWPFCKAFICFQFHHSISICDILFFQFSSHFLNFFFLLLLNWFFFSISPFNQKFIVAL